MIVRNMIVHLDSTPRSADRLALAVTLAARFGARLVGVFAEADSRLLGGSAPESEVAAAYAQAGEAFAARTSAAGVTGVWRSLVHGSHHHVNKTVIEAARRADLTVLGQHNTDDQGRAPRDLVEQVVVNSGRPVLVVPYAGNFPDVGKRAMIAWNGGRESARAANDAIPLIQNADAVTVMAINPQGGGPLDGSGLCDHLACHGIKAERELLSVTDIGVADYVLSHCADMGADLLVMGAFGHYGFPYMLRGGVTKDILEQLTVPVLLAH
ncbi:MAG: universal stress protein [Rhodospirillaceae bacterium]